MLQADLMKNSTYPTQYAFYSALDRRHQLAGRHGHQPSLRKKWTVPQLRPNEQTRVWQHGLNATCEITCQKLLASACNLCRADYRNVHETNKQSHLASGERQ